MSAPLPPDETKAASAPAEDAPAHPLTLQPINIRPWRLIAVLCLIPALVIAFRWEAGLPGLDALSLMLAERQAWAGPSVIAFIERLLSDPLRVSLVVLVLIALVYALLQAIGIFMDNRVCMSGYNIIRPLTGRPAQVDEPRIYRQAMFDWGGWTLLSPLRTGLSLFPMLGFIGTVFGLSAAIRDLPSAIEDSARLGAVLDSLYIAFDTTLLGLFGAVLCLMATRLLEDSIETLERRPGNAG